MGDCKDHVGPPIFTPNEELVPVLTGLGFSRNAAIKALFYTGNEDGNMAACWLLANRDSQDFDAPFENELQGTSDSSEEDELLEMCDSYKMVFVVNVELRMGVGKVAAQVAHAALSLYRLMSDVRTAGLENVDMYRGMLSCWEQYGETKIVLHGDTELQLQQLAERARTVGLAHHLVQDAGHTQVAPGSVTVLGIMGKVDVVDSVTGSLKLL